MGINKPRRAGANKQAPKHKAIKTPDNSWRDKNWIIINDLIEDINFMIKNNYPYSEIEEHSITLNKKLKEMQE